MKSMLIPVVAISSVAAALPAQAEVVQSNSFAAGFSHPVGGMDHIIVMIAVGVWGVLAGGRALWVWPMSFVSTMLVGFMAAILGFPVPWTTAAIFSSIVVLALLVALAVRAPVWVGAAVVGLFAFFHGHAHGTEATAASLPAYAAGFALATAGLHTAGIALGLATESSMGRLTVRVMSTLGLFSVLAWLGS